MTKIEFFGNGITMFSILNSLAEKFNYELTTQSQSPGYLKVTIIPNLTTGHKTVTQKILDAQGYGKIT